MIVALKIKKKKNSKVAENPNVLSSASLRSTSWTRLFQASQPWATSLQLLPTVSITHASISFGVNKCSFSFSRLPVKRDIHCKEAFVWRKNEKKMDKLDV